MDPLEETLDPQDWDAYRRIAHQALDEAIDFVRTVRDRAVWQEVPATVREALTGPLPLDPLPLEDVCREVSARILPYATGNIHPRFWGWVHGTGSPGGIVAEMFAAAMNSNCGGRDHGAIYVERQVIEWCRQMFAFPAQASGLLVSGTSMANLIGMGVARNSLLPDFRKKGLDAESAGRFTAYASHEAHESIRKAVEIHGLGANSLRAIPVCSDGGMNIAALRESIAADRQNGLMPFCVVGSAGTVNTGAIDDLSAIAEVCAAQKLWFHVDGAFGALCILSDRLRSRLAGIEKADSIAFDFHKWAHVQYDAGCILVRRGDLHRNTFATRPAYLAHLARGLGGGDPWPCDFGPELSRGFRALKVWFALKEHGTRKLGRLIDQNVSHAEYLGELVRSHPEFELLSPVRLNIVCFRVLRDSAGEAELDSLNEAIAIGLQTSGIAAPSTTRIDGRLAIRVNFTNHRTRRSDIDLLIESVKSAARTSLP